MSSWLSPSGTELLYSDEEYAVFRDHRPAAEHHFLVVPKRHHIKVSTLRVTDIPMIRRMEAIGLEVLTNRAGKTMVVEDAKIGFHWPHCFINHLHLHMIAPASTLGLLNRVIFSSKFFGDVQTAIQYIEKKEAAKNGSHQ